MNEIRILNELEKATGGTGQHTGTDAIGKGEHEQGKHRSKRNGTALREFVQADVGENKGQSDAQRCVCHHPDRPSALVGHNAVKNDADNHERGKDAPDDGRDFNEFGKHGITPFRMDQIDGRISRSPLSAFMPAEYRQKSRSPKELRL